MTKKTIKGAVIFVPDEQKTFQAIKTGTVFHHAGSEFLKTKKERAFSISGPLQGQDYEFAQDLVIEVIRPIRLKNIPLKSVKEMTDE